MRNGVEFDLLGHVTKGSVRVDDEDWGMVSDYRQRYDNALNFSEKILTDPAETGAKP